MRVSRGNPVVCATCAQTRYQTEGMHRVKRPILWAAHPFIPAPSVARSSSTPHEEGADGA